MAKTYFNKVLTLWTCQTFMENMFTELKLENISFEVLLFFFWQKLRQLRMFLKVLPKVNNSIIQGGHWVLEDYRLPFFKTKLSTF